jgi:alkaline phosphatase D
MNGRWLRRLLAATLLLGAAPTGIGPATPSVDEPRLLVTVGETTASSTRLWLRAESAVARVRVGPADGESVLTLEARPDPTRDHTAVVALPDLKSDVRYVYEVEVDGTRVSGSFVTSPAPDADRAVRLAWSGDLGGGGHCRDAEDGYRIFRALLRRAPELFLFVGDTIYADQACRRARHARMPVSAARTLDDFRAKHRENRTDALVQAFFRTVSVYPIWDDHEVRNNFVGPDEPLMPIGRQAFQEYFPVVGPREEPGRLYRSIRWGRHVEIFILDTRQYRSSNSRPDGPWKTMLGVAQRQWLLDGVAASTATWKLVVSSVPLGLFTGGRNADSWSSANVLGYPRAGTGFAHERDAILTELRRRAVRNLVFLTGDVHHAEHIRHQPFADYAVHELTAGPLSARQGYPRFLDRSLHSRSLTSLGFALNFGELVADGATLTARIIDATGAVRGTTTLRTELRPPTARR